MNDVAKTGRLLAVGMLFVMSGCTVFDGGAAVDDAGVPTQGPAYPVENTVEAKPAPPIAGTGEAPTAAPASPAPAAAGEATGAELARMLDPSDEAMISDAADRALMTGEPVTWSNPTTGNSGRFELQPLYRDEQNRNCRRFTHHLRVGGSEASIGGRACEYADGVWRILA